jgi:hypothetical protein
MKCIVPLFWQSFYQNIHDSALIFTLLTCPLLAMATLLLLPRMVDHRMGL